MSVRITVQAGSEIEGIEIKEPLREMLFPGIPDAAVVTGVRDWLKDRMSLQVQGIIAGGSSGEAANFVDENTNPIS